MRLLVTFAAFVILASVFSLATAQMTITYNCADTQSNQVYAVTFNGTSGNNKRLTLVRGETYNITRLGCDNHPLCFRKDSDDSNYSGASPNCNAAGPMTLTIAANEPETILFYQCNIHGVMRGNIDLVGGTPMAPSTASALVGLPMVFAALLALLVAFLH